VLQESAQELLHFYWIRSAAKFWNWRVVPNSNTLRDMMKEDIPLGNSGASNCFVLHHTMDAETHNFPPGK
jgi:hypothetical protein